MRSLDAIAGLAVTKRKLQAALQTNPIHSAPLIIVGERVGIKIALVRKKSERRLPTRCATNPVCVGRTFRTRHRHRAAADPRSGSTTLLGNCRQDRRKHLRAHDPARRNRHDPGDLPPHVPEAARTSASGALSIASAIGTRANAVSVAISPRGERVNIRVPSAPSDWST